MDNCKECRNELSPKGEENLKQPRKGRILFRNRYGINETCKWEITNIC